MHVCLLVSTCHLYQHPERRPQMVSQELSSKRDLGMKLQLLRPCGPTSRIQGSQSPEAMPPSHCHLHPTPRKLEPTKQPPPKKNFCSQSSIVNPRGLSSHPGSVLRDLPKPLDLSGPLFTQMLNEKVIRRPVGSFKFQHSVSQFQRIKKKASLNDPTKSFHKQLSTNISWALTLCKHCVGLQYQKKKRKEKDNIGSLLEKNKGDQGEPRMEERGFHF